MQTMNSFSNGRKALVLLVASLIAAAIARSFGNKAVATDVYIAELISDAGSCFILAMLVAIFIRGIAGAVTGIVIVAVMAYIIGHNAYKDSHPDQGVYFPLVPARCYGFALNSPRRLAAIC